MIDSLIIINFYIEKQKKNFLGDLIRIKSIQNEDCVTTIFLRKLNKNIQLEKSNLRVSKT